MSDITFLNTLLDIEGINILNNNISIFPDLSSLTKLINIIIENNPIDFSSGQNLINLNYLKSKGVNVTYSPPVIIQLHISVELPASSIIKVLTMLLNHLSKLH